MELLHVETFFQHILAFLKKGGSKSLEAMALSMRSRKQSDVNGLTVLYREKGNPKGIYIVYYGYKTSKFEHYNDVAWIFHKAESEEDEPIALPVKGYEGFRRFRLIDTNTREKILGVINAHIDMRTAQKIKAKNQRELATWHFSEKMLEQSRSCLTLRPFSRQSLA